MKRILSIDGGGIRGLIPALVLARIESETGRPISECFDLIAGTSTGGILALGLCCPDASGKPKYSAKDLVEIYRSRGPEIFPHGLGQTLSSLGGLTHATYPHAGLEKVLLEYFGTTHMGQSLTNTLISTYDILNREPFFFKSWRKHSKDVHMADVCRATSAAPTYFEPFPIRIKKDDESQARDRVLVDGGIFINSPSVSAYAEAIRISPKQSDFFVLSLGTGQLTRPYAYDQARKWGKVSWLGPLLSSMFDGVSDAADYQMKLFLQEQFVRLQVELINANDDLDKVTPKNIALLESEARRLMVDQKEVMKRVYKVLEG